jgi:hypothetical protein
MQVQRVSSVKRRGLEFRECASQPKAHGQLETRVNRVFDDDDIAKIANAYHAWRQDGETGEDYGEASVTCLDLLAMKIHHLIGAMSQTSTPSSIRHRQVAES